ncbi:NAC transcription factor 29-like [Impatiens glandulifera]|uniref:NAC transcription factor 29-like n=1 Tax=Impatiens glandulifera TaxID=253017 RepID=UPI001FB08C47|nr:NAC transcription factor 29-like [Impatiens glandulifera]
MAFEVSDFELIHNFLTKKVQDEPLPHNNIQNVIFYNHQPSHLAKTFENTKSENCECYFFAKATRKLGKGNGAIRKAKNGYWKVIEKDTAITFGNEIIGYKKPFVFYKGKPSKGLKTEWAMFEYRLHDIRPKLKIQDYFKKKDEWVLCKVYKRRELVAKRLTKREKDRLKFRGVANTYNLWNGNYRVTRRIDFEYDTYNKYKGGCGGGRWI